MAFDPGRVATPRDNGAAYVAFDGRHGLSLCDLDDYVAQSHTPQTRCVRFGRAVTGRTRNTRYQAARYTLPGRVLPPLDRADFSQRTPTSFRNQWPTSPGIRRNEFAATRVALAWMG